MSDEEANARAAARASATGAPQTPGDVHESITEDGTMRVQKRFLLN